MASCPSCGAETGGKAGACPRCGAGLDAIPGAGPALELDIPVRKAQKPAAARKKPEEELRLELAVDPRSLVAPPEPAPAPASGPRAREGGQSGTPPVLGRTGAGALAAPQGTKLSVGDIAFDARLLADFGEPPQHWLLSGLYAWRVLRRQRELRAELAGRRAEAARAAGEHEDALVALAERVKPLVQGKEAYATALAEARAAEEVLRSRDAVLAADQDAHRARLASVEARIGKLETELYNAQGDERATMTEIASNQGALGRADTKLKRAESELRAAAREGIGTEP